MQKKFARIVILRHLPRAMDFFDYQLTPAVKVAIGDLVKVPFRNSKKLGVIIDLKKDSSYQGNLKEISEVVSRQILSQEQIALAQKIASYYAVSLSTAINLFISVLPQNKKPLAGIINSAHASSKHPLPLLIIYNNQKTKQNAALQMLDKVIKRQQQLLILVPEKRYLKIWEQSVKQNQIIWHADLKITKKRSAWNCIAQGQKSVIIATRSGLFLPFNNLGGIIIDDAENENYKQYDQNPRFDSITVAEWLKDLHHCPLALLTSAPRTEDWFKAEKGLYIKRIISGYLPATKVKVIDLSKTQVVAQDFPLSDDLLIKIEEQLLKHKKIFIYLNRRGYYTAAVCQDCGHTLQCARCGKVLTWHDYWQKLFCHNCGTKQSLTLPCSICQGTKINFLGIGIEKIEKILGQKFTNYQICRIDYDTQNKLTNTVIKSADILLGTVLAWKYLDFNDFGLIGIISLDNELMVPEFRAEEFTWQKLRYLITNSAAKLYLQTHQPELFIFKYLVKDFDQFYNYLLAQRQKFFWPPVVELLKLTVKDSSLLQAETKIKKIKQLILNQANKNILSLSDFYADKYRQKNNKYVYHLLIKYRADFNPAALWSKLPDDIIIDRQPRFILS